MSLTKNKEFIKAKKEVQADYDKMKAGEPTLIDFEDFEKTISKLKL